MVVVSALIGTPLENYIITDDEGSDIKYSAFVWVFISLVYPLSERVVVDHRKQERNHLNF